jgi:hypothetical protein
MTEVRRRRNTPKSKTAEEEEETTEEAATETAPPQRRRDRAAEPEEAAAAEEKEPTEVDTTTRRSTRAPEPEEPEEAEPEKPASRRKAAGTTKGKLPPGVHTGRAGVEAVRKARGDGAMRMKIGTEPDLVAFLESEPFATFSQHWVSQGGQSGNRPYTCPEEDCPLCDLGDRPNQQVWYNVLHLSAENGPKNMILPLGVKADKALVNAATSKKTGVPDILKDYFAVSKSGKDQQTQTNFRPVKLEDILEDWEEILDRFDIDKLDDILDESLEKMFDVSLVQVTPAKQLREVAAYLAED